jgi:hypothetical protein
MEDLSSSHSNLRRQDNTTGHHNKSRPLDPILPIPTIKIGIFATKSHKTKDLEKELQSP